MGLFRNAALPARLPLGARSSREYVVRDASSNHDDNVQPLLIERSQSDWPSIEELSTRVFH